MKAVVCIPCSDIVAPRRGWRSNRSWRWCECDRTGVRWLDGDMGLLEVTSRHGRGAVRVIGFSNVFLEQAVTSPPDDAEGWRELHTTCAADVSGSYLFNTHRRACWAIVVRPGEASDVVWVSYADARGGELAAAPTGFFEAEP